METLKKIKTFYIILFSFIFITSELFLNVYTINYFEEVLLKQRYEQNEALVQLAFDSIKNIDSNKNYYESIINVLRDMAVRSVFDNESFICVIDSNGYIVAHLDPNRIGAFRGDQKIQTTSGLKPFVGESYLVEGLWANPVSSRIEIVTSLHNTDANITVAAHQNKSLVDKKLSAIRTYLVIFSVAVFAILFLMGLALTRIIVDKYVNQIELYEKELETTNERLEERVAERTSELATSNEKLQQALHELEQLKNQLHAENLYLQEEIKGDYNFEEMIGSSGEMQKVFQDIERVAKTDSTVLITGETGTGKELVAHAIHNLSDRKNRALIKVNCAALPGGLIESELFGHEKGAFTGATARKKGRFELADGGSILLDETGELTLETQAKLLRVMQEQEVEPVGSTKSIKVNVRVIAATNRDLQENIKQGGFRSDLFYRLNVFPISIPPLRKRREDIPLLSHYFIDKFSKKMGKRIKEISPMAIKTLSENDWAGNVRELANILERAVIHCDGTVLQNKNIAILKSAAGEENSLKTLEEAERAHILNALERTNRVVGGPQGAAKILGVNRTTLIAKMKKLGITNAPSENKISE